MYGWDTSHHADIPYPECHKYLISPIRSLPIIIFIGFDMFLVCDSAWPTIWRLWWVFPKKKWGKHEILSTMRRDKIVDPIWQCHDVTWWDCLQHLLLRFYLLPTTDPRKNDSVMIQLCTRLYIPTLAAAALIPGIQQAKTYSFSPFLL